MKKLFFTLAIALGVATAASAQDAGQYWVGGAVGFGSTKVNDGDRSTDFRILPEFGYILSENLGVGVSIGGGHRNVAVGEGSAEQNFYKVSPFLRYTFLKGDIGGLFVDAGFGYSWSKYVSGGAHGHRWEAGLKPGVAINVSSKVALLGKFGFLGYEYDKYSKDSKTDKFGFDLHMDNVEFGVNFRF